MKTRSKEILIDRFLDYCQSQDKAKTESKTPQMILSR
jgi:hypothetical protein